MSLTTSEAFLFLPFVLAIGLWTAFQDMKEMKITNVTVLILAGVFLVLGWTVLPFDAYLWRLAMLVIVLIITFVMNAVGMIGGGDAKFAAAMAAYIAWGDWGFVGILFAGLLIITTFVIWTARKTPITNLAPDWKCWSSGRHLPMGVTLGATLILYYLLGAFAQ